MVNFGEFLKSEACGQTVFPDISKEQKLVENAKIEKLKCDILGDFQTLCTIIAFYFLCSDSRKIYIAVEHCRREKLLLQCLRIRQV